jgi:hypothetical protein
MRSRLIYIFWLVVGLTAFIVLGYYYRQLERSERHLAKKMRYFKISDPYRTYQQLMPQLHAWRKPENPAELKEYFTKDRSYVYQSEQEFNDYLKSFGKEGRESYLRSAKRVLLSPVSRETKERYINGNNLSFDDSAFIQFTTNDLKRPRREFMWVEAVDSEEAAWEWWRDKDPILKKAKEDKIIADYKDLLFLAVDPLELTNRYELLKDVADEEIYTASLRNEAPAQGLDKRLFKVSKGRLGASGFALQPPLTVSEQFNRWRELGLTNLLHNYLLPRSNGFWAVVRIDGGEGKKAEAALKLSELHGTNDLPLVICEGALKLEYQKKMNALIKWVMLCWLLVFGLIVVLQTIRQFFLHFLMGRGFVPEVMYRFYSPGARAYLIRNGYKTFTHVMTLEEVERKRKEGQEVPEVMVMRVHEKKGNIRRIDSIQLEAGFRSICPSGQVWVKRAYGKGMKELRREFINMRRMTRRGVKTPKILSYCEAQWKGYWCGYLMIANLDGLVPFDYWQTYSAPYLEEKERSEIVRSLSMSMSGCLRRCHRHGIFKLQLFGKHIFFDPKDLKAGVTLIDVEKACCLNDTELSLLRRFPWLYKRYLAPDLAFLNRYLFWELWPLKERLRMYVNYCRRSSFPGADKIPLNAEERARLDKVSRICVKKGYGQYQKVGDVFLNVACYDEIRDTLPRTFREYFAITSEENVTRKKGRTVVKIQRGGKTYYLKRHTGMSWKDALLEYCRHGRRMSNARLEWKAMQIADSLGIPNMPFRAFGEKFSAFRERSSFLLTEALPPGRTVEDQLRDGLDLPLAQRILLCKRIAGIARKLHGAGYVHKDFYLGHFYVVGDLMKDDYVLHLLDLQRLARGAKILNRWSLKDMTALYFSALPFLKDGLISRTDMLRLYHFYVGRERLEEKDRKFLAKLFLKEKKIARHTEKLLAKRRKRGELEGLVK